MTFEQLSPNTGSPSPPPAGCSFFSCRWYKVMVFELLAVSSAHAAALLKPDEHEKVYRGSRGGNAVFVYQAALSLRPKG